MCKKTSKIRTGFTIVELMVTVLLSMIILLAIAVVLVHSQQGWKKMYSRIYSDVVTDAYCARTAFDSIVRKATIKSHLTDGTYLEVYYYEDLNSINPDRYAQFYLSNGDLDIAFGYLQAGTFNKQPSSEIKKIASNVTSCTFSTDGTCAKMDLTLSNNKESMALLCSATMHNE